MLGANSGLKELFLGYKNVVNPRGSMSETEFGFGDFERLSILRTLDFVGFVVLRLVVKNKLKNNCHFIWWCHNKCYLWCHNKV